MFIFYYTARLNLSLKFENNAFFSFSQLEITAPFCYKLLKGLTDVSMQVVL